MREKKGHTVVIFQEAMVSPLAHYKTGSCSCLLCYSCVRRDELLPAVLHFSCTLLQHTAPIHSDLRDPSSVRKFRLCREKHAVGSRCPWSNMFSSNRSAFAACNLPLLVMHREVEGQAEAEAGAQRR